MRSTRTTKIVYGKDPDVEIFTQTAELPSERSGMKTNKPRSLRPLWLQGRINRLPRRTACRLAGEVVDEDEGQPSARREMFAVAQGWRGEVVVERGRVQRYKVGLIRWWFGQVGGCRGRACTIGGGGGKGFVGEGIKEVQLGRKRRGAVPCEVKPHKRGGTSGMALGPTLAQSPLRRAFRPPTPTLPPRRAHCTASSLSQRPLS